MYVPPRKKINEYLNKHVIDQKKAKKGSRLGSLCHCMNLQHSVQNGSEKFHCDLLHIHTSDCNNNAADHHEMKVESFSKIICWWLSLYTACNSKDAWMYA